MSCTRKSKTLPTRKCGKIFVDVHNDNVLREMPSTAVTSSGRKYKRGKAGGPAAAGVVLQDVASECILSFAARGQRADETTAQTCARTLAFTGEKLPTGNATRWVQVNAIMHPERQPLDRRAEAGNRQIGPPSRWRCTGLL